MAGQEPLRILLVDDHALFRECVAAVLSAGPEFDVSHCASIAEALRIIGRERVDVVLLDYDLGAERGSEFLPAAARAGFDGRVLVVAASVSDAEALRLVRQGVAGIFVKENPLEALKEAIRAVGRGDAWLDQRYLRLLASPEPRPEAETARQLSERERQVLRCLLEGMSNKQIAARLGAGEPSIKTTLQRLFDRMGVRTRAQLVRIVLERYPDQV